MERLAAINDLGDESGSDDDDERTTAAAAAARGKREKGRGVVQWVKG